jgi:hypothetical protein
LLNQVDEQVNPPTGLVLPKLLLGLEANDPTIDELTLGQKYKFESPKTQRGWLIFAATPTWRATNGRVAEVLPVLDASAGSRLSKTSPDLKLKTFVNANLLASLRFLFETLKTLEVFRGV